jgi:hypothetical protein
MSNQVIPAGLVALLGATSWITGACVTPLKLDGSLTATAIRQVTAATNATPIVCTVDTTHNWSNGDLIVIIANGANGNTAAIGTFRITSASTNVFSLQSADDVTPVNTTGNGTWSGTAAAINLSKIATFADVSAAKVGGQTDPVLSNCVVMANGIIDADDPASWSAWTGTVHAFLIALGNTPGAAGNVPVVFQDGKTCVHVVATAATSATTIAVAPLEGNIASGTSIVFSNGVTATLTAGGTAGDKTLTVLALASPGIPVGHTGDAPVTGSGLPATLTSGTLTETFSSATNRIAKL